MQLLLHLSKKDILNEKLLHQRKIKLNLLKE